MTPDAARGGRHVRLAQRAALHKRLARWQADYAAVRTGLQALTDHGRPLDPAAAAESRVRYERLWAELARLQREASRGR